MKENTISKPEFGEDAIGLPDSNYHIHLNDINCENPPLEMIIFAEISDVLGYGGDKGITYTQWIKTLEVINKHNLTLIQENMCTGKYDCNDKMIFVGNIVEIVTKDFIGSVKYDNDNCKFIIVDTYGFFEEFKESVSYRIIVED